MVPRPLVTLTTDFGTADPYVGAMKGMILRYCPDAEIIDITHDVPPHNILAGAFVIAHATPYFPENALHVVVVDPGVGTDRGILVGQFGRQVFLFPDNGVITLIKHEHPLEALVEVRNRSYNDAEGVSRTFHGRDLFAPLAGEILSGVDISQFGPTPSSYKLLDIPQPREHQEKILGKVLYVDQFGNLVTNIPSRLIRQRYNDLEGLFVECNGQRVGGICETYGLTDPGRPLALFNSMGLLEVAVNQARAADTFHSGVGTEVTVGHQEYLDV